MKLYHYTPLSNFLLIWKDKRLKFSFSKNTNDFFERDKAYTITPETFSYKGKRLSGEAFRRFRLDVEEELNRYRQVSFCRDYSVKMQGFSSPMMWGQYARSKNKDGNWQDGVCIELESDLMERPSIPFYEHKVVYSDNIKIPFVRDIDFTKEDAAERFIVRNRNLLYFTKHRHWEYDREYRFISRSETSLGIENAITAIYVLNSGDSTLDEVENAVKDDSLIYFINMGFTKGRHFVALNLKGYRDDLDFMKQWNENIEVKKGNK